jgi:hypothetical protein
MGGKYEVEQYGECSILLYMPGNGTVGGIMLTVHIHERSFFTLYARGNILGKRTVNGLGTFIRFGGVVILSYKYPHHRRLYIVRSRDELSHYRPVSLPNVRREVGVILRAKGRKIDMVRRAYWNLEQINGKGVYTWDTLFWQKLGCLVDTFNGGKSAAVKSNLILLSGDYRLRHDR